MFDFMFMFASIRLSASRVAVGGLNGVLFLASL